MNIPLKEGDYEVKIGQNNFSISIHTEAVRMNKLDQIQRGDLGHIGGYKYIRVYRVEVNDNNGNHVDRIDTEIKEEYISFMSKYIGEENGTAMNPSEIITKLERKFQKETGLYVTDKKFNGIVKDMIKVTYFVDDWHNGKYDPSIISSYLEGLGFTCKIADKKKNIRATSCYVVTVFIPFDFTLNETRKKKTTISEAKLNKIIKESVSKVIKDILG